MFEAICVGAVIAICFTSSDVLRLHAHCFLYVTPMHVWEPIFLKRYAHACFRVEHCLYVTPMHVCVFASALPTLELCKSLKVNSFGRIQAGCADANLHIYIYMNIYIYSPVQSSLIYLIYIHIWRKHIYIYIRIYMYPYDPSVRAQSERNSKI